VRHLLIARTAIRLNNNKNQLCKIAVTGMTLLIRSIHIRKTSFLAIQVFALLLLAVVAKADHKGAGREYAPAVLPPLPGHITAIPTSINNRGEVAGASWAAGGPSRVVVWSRKNSIKRILLPLPGDESSGLDNVSCNAINARGEVVGISKRPGGPSTTVVWNRYGHISRTLLPLPGDTDVTPSGGINAAGMVAGISYGSGVQTAVVWNRKGKIVRAFPPLAGQNNTRATGINDRGDVVGIGESPGTRAVVWDRYGIARILEPLEGDDEYSEAWAINNRGVTAGISENGRTTALVWDRKGNSKVLTRLDPSNSIFARDINDKGEVAGENGNTPVIWNRAGAALALPLLPGQSYAGTCGINNRGEVVGSGGSVGVVWRLVKSRHRPLWVISRHKGQ